MKATNPKTNQITTDLMSPSKRNTRTAISQQLTKQLCQEKHNIRYCSCKQLHKNYPQKRCAYGNRKGTPMVNTRSNTKWGETCVCVCVCVCVGWLCILAICWLALHPEGFLLLFFWIPLLTHSSSCLLSPQTMALLLLLHEGQLYCLMCSALAGVILTHLPWNHCSHKSQHIQNSSSE